MKDFWTQAGNVERADSNSHLHEPPFLSSFQLGISYHLSAELPPQENIIRE